MSTKPYDIIVFGATSFVGRILTQYLLDTLGTDAEIQWAIAGRSEEKLQTLKNQLGSSANNLELLTADADDELSLQQLCDKTRVMVSTVGPYALYGGLLVKVCAETGTDYCDLTGEVQWIQQMINLHEHKAQQTGARIVHACGFDSIPSDMGVYHLQQIAQRTFGQSCTTLKMRVKTLKAGISGGTAASLVNIAKEAATNAQLRKTLKDPFALCPQGHNFSAVQFNIQHPRYDNDFHSWAAPFVMAGVNTRVVHRTNALLNKQYGQTFKYDEAILTGDATKGKRRAMLVTMGLKSLLIGAAIKPSRWALTSFILPKSGEGPSPHEQEKGRYDLLFHGTTDDGQTLQTRVTGDKDPGYGSTAKMLGQAAICLAASQKPGGFWTPATVFEEPFIETLQEKSGLTFSVV